MRIGFLSNKLTLRGTEVNLYDYADCAERILGHTSIIITRPYDLVMRVSPRDVHPGAYKKFQDRFTTEFYEQIQDITAIVKRTNIDVLFIEKAGSPDDGLVFDCCKTIIHCVFTTLTPHGSLYTSISESLNKINKTNLPVLPYMVRVHPTKEDFRLEYGIPKDAIVFGSYSGADEYTIDYVKQAVIDIASNSAFKHIYFIYLNIDAFGPECQRIKFFPGTADMEYKKRFINTCDAMLYGRSGGETFGLAVGEFSISGKPVIARLGEHSCAHEDILGDAMIKCSKYEEVYDVLTNWGKYKKDVSNNGYCNYTEEKVMENFQKHIQTLCFPKQTYFTNLLDTINKNMTLPSLLQTIINPFSLYFLCDHFIGDELKFIPVNMETKDLLKSNNLANIKDYDIVHVQVNYFEHFCVSILDKLDKKIVLTTGQWHSPQLTTSYLTEKVLNHPNIILWVSQNPIYENSQKYMGFPYGIYHGNLLDYAKGLLHANVKKVNEIAYLPLSHNTNICRQKLPVLEKIPMSEFYKEIAKAKFVLSPIGDRDDCYRHYESIGLGAVPISNVGRFYKSIFTKSMYYCTIDEMLTILNTQQLNYEYAEPNKDLVCLQYYIDEVKNKIEEIKKLCVSSS